MSWKEGTKESFGCQKEGIKEGERGGRTNVYVLSLSFVFIVFVTRSLWKGGRRKEREKNEGGRKKEENKKERERRKKMDYLVMSFFFTFLFFLFFFFSSSFCLYSSYAVHFIKKKRKEIKRDALMAFLFPLYSSRAVHSACRRKGRKEIKRKVLLILLFPPYSLSLARWKGKEQREGTREGNFTRLLLFTFSIFNPQR